MLSLFITSVFYLFSIFSIYILLRLFLYQTSLIHVFTKWKNLFEDTIHVHQFFKVPQTNENSQQNQFHKKVLTYLNSTSSLEDSDFTNLFSGKKSNDIILSLDDNQTVHDVFLGARVSWKNENKTLVLKIKKKDKRRILRPYLQHIHTISNEIQQRRGELNLFINNHGGKDGRWTCVPFTHQSSFETIVMDSDVKSKVKSDLELFLKSEQYYHRIGKVWRKSFLLYGPSGTGKSSFVSAMARFLSYDVYDVDLSLISDDSDLKMLLLQTTNKSLIVVEDLDLYLNKSETAAVSISGLMNFMDGILNSCSSDEKIMVFTMNSKEEIDPSILRPGRIDVQIYFPLCDFKSFKLLASNYLGIKEHKLFQQVEEVFQSGSISPAEVSEIMIANRGSPSRAMKSVITAMQGGGRGGGGGRRLDETVEMMQSSVFGKDSLPVKELRKLYGLLKLKTSKKVGPFDDDEPGLIKG